MFLAMQKVRLEKIMLMAATRTTSYLENAKKDMQPVVKRCMWYFPVMWVDEFDDEFFLLANVEALEEELEEEKLLELANDFLELKLLNKCSRYLWSLFQKSTSSFQTHHQLMIATILVLDLASVLIPHKQSANIHQVLHLAYSQAEKSGVFTRILETFSGTYEHYALDSCHAFMLQNRLIISD